MPTLEDIEKFKADVNALGHEPSILADRGEKLEDVAPPEGISGEVLDELFSETEETALSPENLNEEDSGSAIDTGSDLDDVEGEGPEDLFSGTFDDEDIFQPDDLGASDEEDIPDALDSEGIDDEFSLPETGDDFSFDDDFFSTESEDTDSADTPEDVESLDEESLDEGFDDIESLEEGEEDAEETDEIDDLAGFVEDMEDIPAEDTPAEDLDEANQEDDFSLDDAFAPIDETDDLFSDIEESEALADELLGDVDEIAGGEDELNEPDEQEPEDDFSMPEDLLGGLEEDLSSESLGDEESDDDFSTDFDGMEPAEERGEEPEDISALAEDADAFADMDEEFSLPSDDELFGSAPGEEEEAVEDADTAAAQGPEDDEGVDEEPDFVPEEFSLFDEGEDEGIPEFSMPEGFPFNEEEAEPGEAAEDVSGDEDFAGAPESPPDADDSFSLPDEFEIPSAGDIDSLDEEDFEVDEFNLGDLGAQFGEFDASQPHIDEAGGSQAPAEAEELLSSDSEFEISEEDFEAIQKTMSLLPLNLKIAIEELIGEKGLDGEPLRGLVQKLINGAPPKELATTAGKIIGRKIQIPSGYEKSTGEAFELEKGTIGYTLRYNVLPILRITAAALVIMGLTGYLGYSFLYRPLRALALYNQGYEELESKRFNMSESYFDRALDQWRYKKQFFRYAQGYQEQNQYNLAARKYQSLLRNYPFDKKATLEYGRMESTQMENHVLAEEIYDNYLKEKDKYEYEVLLAAGDNYLAWGEYDPSKYEDARYSYAVLMQRYGMRSELLFRMLKYFIRTDNYEEVVKLKDQFASEEDLEIDPYIYTELGGYLITKDKLDDVRKILFQVLDVNEQIAETHYHLGRYFRKVDEPEEEKKALRHSLVLFENKEPLTKKDVRQYIDAENRYGEALFEDKAYLDAEQHFMKARQRYEEAAARRMAEPMPLFGRIYKNLADLYYYVSGELENAYALYERGEELGYATSDVSYKKGYIRYLSGDYKEALSNFYSADEAFVENDNLKYAMANSFFQRKDFHSAQGYYTRLLEDLEHERSSALILEPEEREDHRALLENIMRSYNNLGVTYNRLSQANNDTEKFDQSLVYFTKSMELFDLLTRDPETDARREVKNLSYLNQRAVLFPMGDFDLQIYPDIPKDMESLYYR